MDNEKKYGSRYWLCKLIDKGLLDTEIERIPGVKTEVGGGKPAPGEPQEMWLETYLKKNKMIQDDDPFLTWWVPSAGKKATWDYICRAEINGKKGLILLEAKAHKGETNKKGDIPHVPGKATDSNKAGRNFRQKEQNIKEEFKKFDIAYDASVHGYYQVANRIAYASRIHSVLNIPVLLIFLGFIGDAHFKDKWENEAAWLKDMNAYLKALSLPCAKENEITELAPGGPFITCLSVSCSES